MIRRQLRYTGRVQGVGFRATTRAIASRHLVTGWVKNEPDGAVLMEVQGEPAEVEKCLAEISQTMARNINRADEHDTPVDRAERAFEIRY